MATYTTCWLLGSYPSLPTQGVKFNASAQSVPSGSFYLYDSNNALSLLAQVKAAMTAAGLAGANAVLCGNRRVKLSSAALFSVEWTSPLLRTLLGFTGDMAAATSHIAPLISPLHWSPAKPESPQLTRQGVRGHREALSVTNVSSYSGRVETVTHGTREYQSYRFPNVDISRVETSDDLGGTWARWFETVCVPGASWKLYSGLTENTTSTTAISIAGTGLGPYTMSPKGKGSPQWKFDRSRGMDFMDRACDIAFDCHVVPEYTS